MTTTTKVLSGLGTVTAIAVIYFGFTDKGKNKWASLMGPKTTDPLAGKPRMPLTAEDAGTIRNADGLRTSMPPRGTSYGGSLTLKEVKNNNGVVIGWVDKDGVKWTKA